MVIVLILIAIVLYTAFDLFVAKAGGKINDSLASAIFNGLGALVPLVIYMVMKNQSKNNFTKEGIVYSVLAGVSIAIFSIILVNIFSRAENVSFVLPAIYGGTVVLGALAGVVVFKEQLNTLTTIGLVITIIGLGLIVYSRATA